MHAVSFNVPFAGQNLPGGGAKIGFQKIWGGGNALMHSNYVICIVGVSRGVRFVKGGEILSGGTTPLCPPFNGALLWDTDRDYKIMALGSTHGHHSYISQ